MPAIVFETFIISFVIQIFFFLLAAFFKTDKVTDLSYSLSFILIAWFVFLFRSPQLLPHLILTIMVTIWGIRLGTYLLIRIITIKKDSRFDGIRENMIAFAQFWIVQAVAVWIVMLTTSFGLTKGNFTHLSFASIFGISVWFLGLALETIADYQKYKFKLNPKNKDTFISTGIWKYSRHPNYFGEMLVWWGIYLTVLPQLRNFELLTIISPIFIMSLIIFFSGIPPLEKRYQQKYKDNKAYQEYKASTNLLIPWF